MSILSRCGGLATWYSLHKVRDLNVIPSLTVLLSLPHRDGAINSGNGFTHAKWKETKTFWEALAYMIVKGINERMPPMVTVSPLVRE